MSSNRVDFEVQLSEEGQRLDHILVQRIPDLSRNAAAALFRAGAVRVDGRRAVKSLQPAAGAQISVELPPAAVATAEAGLPLDVCLERDDLVVVNKPAGQPSAVIRPTDRDTLVNALLARYPEMATVGFGPREPGIIHRLDTQTSGLLIAARTPHAFEILRKALESGVLTKHYLAIVESSSIDDAGVIDAWLGPHPRSRKKVAVHPAGSKGARAARSEYQVLERKGNWALVRLTAPRAYRHQVRAHLALRGSPIAGDVLYGGPEAGLAGRHALHASSVRYQGPALEPFEVSAPCPEDLQALLQ